MHLRVVHDCVLEWTARQVPYNPRKHFTASAAAVRVCEPAAFPQVTQQPPSMPVAPFLQLHEKNMRDYEATVQAMTNWQSTGTRFYLPGAPTHFPVVVQRQWATLSHSPPTTTTTTSSSSAQATEADAKGAQQAAAETVAAVRQLSLEEQRALADISSVVQQQLGSGLPDRALRGERSLLLASLAPQAVKERLARWVAVCGKEYVAQLVMKEPTLLGHEPRVLLDTLEGVSQEMGLSTQVGAAAA